MAETVDAVPGVLMVRESGGRVTNLVAKNGNWRITP